MRDNLAFKKLSIKLYKSLKIYVMLFISLVARFHSSTPIYCNIFVLLSSQRFIKIIKLSFCGYIGAGLMNYL